MSPAIPVKSVHYKDRIYLISIRSLPKPSIKGRDDQNPNVHVVQTIFELEVRASLMQGSSGQYQNNILPHSLVQLVQPCFIKTVARSPRLFVGSLLGLASDLTFWMPVCTLCCSVTCPIIAL